MYNAVLPGMAKILDIRISGTTMTLGMPPLLVEFEVEDGIRTVYLSPERFRNLMILEAFRTGKLLPIPTP
jgi:hypothetical protein